VCLIKIVLADNCPDLFTKVMPKDGYCRHHYLMVTKGPKSIRNIPGEVMSHEENASK
jgi:hypothetical protein